MQNLNLVSLTAMFCVIQHKRIGLGEGENFSLASFVYYIVLAVIHGPFEIVFNETR